MFTPGQAALRGPRTKILRGSAGVGRTRVARGDIWGGGCQYRFTDFPVEPVLGRPDPLTPAWDPARPSSRPLIRLMVLSVYARLDTEHSTNILCVFHLPSSSVAPDGPHCKYVVGVIVAGEKIPPLNAVESRQRPDIEYASPATWLAGTLQ